MQSSKRNSSLNNIRKYGGKKMSIDYWCKCKECKNVDPTERKGYKWYCTEYKTYEDPDDVRECREFKDRRK